MYIHYASILQILHESALSFFKDRTFYQAMPKLAKNHPIILEMHKKALRGPGVTFCFSEYTNQISADIMEAGLV